MPEDGSRAAAISIRADTIFAPATEAERAAIAIIRLSGPEAHGALCALAGAPLPPWRQLVRRALRGPDGELIDHAMVVVFPAGASYTGEAMGEIHCHGGNAVVSDVLACLADLPGCRLAEPGEFTQRAFFDGRLDLSEVEGLADLIAAETSGQRRQALRMLSGAVSRQCEGWRALLLQARALIELTIDWADEEVPEDVERRVKPILERLMREMSGELSRAGAAERMRTGFEVAIVGPPNVGKSSLLNAIAGREAAIVSEVAGTTRDVIEVRFDLGGLPVVFLDTAGLRVARDTVEQMGIDRARQRAAAADLRLVLRSPDTGECPDNALPRNGDISVWAKSDLGQGDGEVAVSARDNLGIEELLETVRMRLGGKISRSGVLGNARQRIALERSRRDLDFAAAALAAGEPEVAAEHLRLAEESLERLVGRIGVEDVLGEVFGSFCLGK